MYLQLFQEVSSWNLCYALGKTTVLTMVEKSYLCMHVIYKLDVKISGYYLSMQVLQLNCVYL